MAEPAGVAAARARLASIRARLPHGGVEGAGGPSGDDGVIPFEVSGESVFVTLERGLPVAVERGPADADWSIVVDDWDLVIPHGTSRALGTLSGCGLRLDGELLPLPTRFEADRYSPDRFPERIPRASLFVFNEQRGTPVGSLHFAVRFEDGVPAWVGDRPDPLPGVPRIAMAYSWPLYWAYRLRQAPQIRVTNGSAIDGHWKDLYTLHGLQDHEGFFRNVAAYPSLPPLLLTYCRMLAVASAS